MREREFELAQKCLRRWRAALLQREVLAREARARVGAAFASLQAYRTRALALRALHAKQSARGDPAGILLAQSTPKVEKASVL